MSTDPWRWAADGYLPGFCITFVRGLSPAEFIGALGGDPDHATVHTGPEAAQAYPIDAPGSLLRCGTVTTWAFCYEDRGPVANRPATIRRLSTGTALLQVTKGGDGMNLVKHFADGRRIESFEPVDRSTLRGDGPYRLLPLSERYVAAHPGVLELIAALHVIGDEVGGDLDRAILDGPLLTALTTTAAPATHAP